MGQVSLLCMLVQTLLVMVEQESTLISGYHSVPSENDYWSTSEDMEYRIFPKTMSRDRFRLIKRYFNADKTPMTIYFTFVIYYTKS